MGSQGVGVREHHARFAASRSCQLDVPERTCVKEIDAFPIPLGEDEVVKSMVLAVVKVAL